MDPTLHAKCCGSFWKPRRSHRRIDFCALFWEARLWRIAELLPTEKKLHLRPPARPVQHGLNLGASGGADPKEHASFENSQRPSSDPEILSQVSHRERAQASSSISAH
jgi:hypothetical protein